MRMRGCEYSSSFLVERICLAAAVIYATCHCYATPPTHTHTLNHPLVYSVTHVPGAHTHTHTHTRSHTDTLHMRTIAHFNKICVEHGRSAAALIDGLMLRAFASVLLHSKSAQRKAHAAAYPIDSHFGKFMQNPCNNCCVVQCHPCATLYFVFYDPFDA